MKKLLSILLCILLVMPVLYGCENKEPDENISSVSEAEEDDMSLRVIIPIEEEIIEATDIVRGKVIKTESNIEKSGNYEKVIWDITVEVLDTIKGDKKVGDRYVFKASDIGSSWRKKAGGLLKKGDDVVLTQLHTDGDIYPEYVDLRFYVSDGKLENKFGQEEMKKITTVSEYRAYVNAVLEKNTHTANDAFNQATDIIRVKIINCKNNINDDTILKTKIEVLETLKGDLKSGEQYEINQTKLPDDSYLFNRAGGRFKENQELILSYKYDSEKKTYHEFYKARMTLKNGEFINNYGCSELKDKNNTDKFKNFMNSVLAEEK